MPFMVFNSIYVLPSTPGVPPQAILVAKSEEVTGDDGEDILSMEGALVRLNHDLGTWFNPADGLPLPQEIADCITEHAKNLGVEW